MYSASYVYYVIVIFCQRHNITFLILGVSWRRSHSNYLWYTMKYSASPPLLDFHNRCWPFILIFWLPALAPYFHFDYYSLWPKCSYILLNNWMMNFIYLPEVTAAVRYWHFRKNYCSSIYYNFLWNSRQSLDFIFGDEQRQALAYCSFRHNCCCFHCYSSEFHFMKYLRPWKYFSVYLNFTWTTVSSYYTWTDSFLTLILRNYSYRNSDYQLLLFSLLFYYLTL